MAHLNTPYNCEHCDEPLRLEVGELLGMDNSLDLVLRCENGCTGPLNAFVPFKDFIEV